MAYRLERMENEGLILGYSAVVDVTAIGFFCFRIYIDFQHMTSLQTEQFVKEMKRHSEVVQAYLIRGHWDAALYVVLPSLMHFRKLWDKILLNYKKEIKEHSVFTYAPIYNLSKPFLNRSSLRTVRSIGVADAQKVSSEDWQLIQLYSQNVRVSLIELSKKLNRSRYAIKKRLKELRESKIISGTNVDLDPQKLDQKFYTIALSLESFKIIDSLYDFCSMQRSIYQINRIIGGDDFEIKVMVKSKQELVSLIDKIKLKFPGKIRDDNYFSFQPVYSRGIVPY